MPTYAYRARGTRGEPVNGRLEAASADAVAEQLLAIGMTPVEIRETGAEGAIALPAWLAKLLAPRVALSDLVLFSRQMHTLLKAGVPMRRALAGLHESATNPTFREVVADLRASLDAGRELSQAMLRHPDVFTPFYVSIVRVGETSGKLEEVFRRLFDYLEFEREVRERVKTALRYPAFVLVAIAVAIAIVNFMVIPAFARIFEGANVPLPALTRLLIGVSDFSVRYWYLVVGGAAGAVVGFQVWIRSERGRYAWDRAKLRLPVVGPILLKTSLSRFARAFSLAIAAGVPIVQALTVVARVLDNVYLGARVEQMRDGIGRGESILRSATAAGVFTPVVLQMIAVGEESGAIDDLLGEVADMYEREVDYEVKNLSASIEPILTVALGVLVLILALGVFLPIWEMGRVMLMRK
ncbi:MAG: type II secretion system F family protein [Burkholderiales bacterium]|nr:type II secretion system F family protein [Burkholderiales bacterium]